MASTQCGAAIAKTLFDDLGPAATAFLRVALAAVLLALIWRPRLAGHARRDLALAAAFGLALCLMNLTFYEAIARIPLGIAVTIEFAGPLGVAIALSRRAIDAIWVVLAAAGILAAGARRRPHRHRRRAARTPRGRLLGGVHPAERARGARLPRRLRARDRDGHGRRGPCCPSGSRAVGRSFYNRTWSRQRRWWRCWPRPSRTRSSSRRCDACPPRSSGS